MVYVRSKSGEPLMPCENVVARLLLSEGKAKCIRREPFVIKLTYEGTEYVQPLTLGVDTGSETMGAAAVGEDGGVWYASEVQVRNDISGKMEQRAKHRRARRGRKTRYRKARFANRGNSKREGRFSPTTRSKIESHEKEMKFVKGILPIAEVIMEAGQFDAHALKNPAVLENKWLYQRGANYGYANTKGYILARDGHECKKCKGKAKDSKKEVHHIIWRSRGGGDEPENLVTLCKSCHDGVHGGTVRLSLKGKEKGQLKHATQMNAIRSQLLKRAECRETYGFITKEHRQIMVLAKTHSNDAVAIACLGNIERTGTADVSFRTDIMLTKKCIADGDYQQTKGIRGEQAIPTGKIQGYRKFDKVRYQGREYFIKGRMSTGYAVLMDIHGVKAELKPMPKFDGMERVGARKTWITQAETIPNTY
jgi:5-methylcytosine-specific restriction endonuclease McrA